MTGSRQQRAGATSLTQQSGLCLSELMVALAVGTVVLAGSLEALNIVQAQAVRQQGTMAAQQEMRIGMEVFEQEARMASSANIVTALPDRFEFLANIHALQTLTTGSVVPGQTVLPVQNGSGWGAGKTVVLCGASGCESHELADQGQRTQLRLDGPVGGMYSAGASVAVRNRVIYYTRRDDGDRLQFMRQIDGGAGVLVGNVQSVRLSYWDEWGRVATGIGQVTRVVVEVVQTVEGAMSVREVTVRS